MHDGGYGRFFFLTTVTSFRYCPTSLNVYGVACIGYKKFVALLKIICIGTCLSELFESSESSLCAQDPANKKMIVCDDRLQELFGVDTFVGFGITKLLSPHFLKS